MGLNYTLLDIVPTKLYCLGGNFNLTSSYNVNEESFLQITISLCDENSLVCNFKANQLTDSILYLKLIFLQSLLSSQFQAYSNQQSNIDNLQYIPIVFEYKIDRTTLKEVDIELSKIEIKKREEGLLSNLFVSNDYQFFKQGIIFQDQAIMKESIMQYTNQAPLFRLKFQNRGQKKVVLIDTQSIIIKMCQNLANFGGLLVALLGVIGLFYGIYQKHKIIVSLMKSTFYFDFQLRQKDRIQNTRTKELEKQLIERSGSSSLNLAHRLGQKVDYSFYQFLWMKTKEFCQTFADLFGINIMAEDKNDKMRIYRLAEQKIEQDLDITHILKRLYDIDKLKLLLLDEEQIQLFNTLAKPVIKISRQKSLRLHRQSTMNTQMIKVSQFFQSGAIIQDGKQLFRIYQRIKENENKNIEMNYKLLQLVKEHDLVQNILNKEELFEQIRIKFLQKSEISDKNSESQQQCESQMNKSCLRERAESVQKQCPKKNTRSFSLVDIGSNLKSKSSKSNLTIKNGSMAFRKSMQLSQQQLNQYLNKVTDKQTKDQMQNSVKLNNPLESSQNNLIPKKRLEFKSLNDSLNLKSFYYLDQIDEFNFNRIPQTGTNRLPNKLKLWKQQQNPFIIYKNNDNCNKQLENNYQCIQRTSTNPSIKRFNIQSGLKDDLQMIEERQTDNTINTIETYQDKNQELSNHQLSKQLSISQDNIKLKQQNSISPQNKIIKQGSNSLEQQFINEFGQYKQNLKKYDTNFEFNEPQINFQNFFTQNENRQAIDKDDKLNKSLFESRNFDII